MATRFYLPSSGTAPFSPAYSAGWENQTIAARLPAFTTKQTSAMTTVSFTDANAANQDILFRQYISEPLAAQVIAAQSLEYRMRVAERATSCNLFSTINVKLVSYDGSVTRGTLLAMQRDDGEADTVLENRRITATTTAITCHHGDRLVFEVGTGGDPAAGSDHDSDISIGDDNASDLPEDDSTQTALNPFIEFPNTLTFWQAEDLIVHEITEISMGVSGTGITAAHVVSANLTNRVLVALIGRFDPTDADRAITAITYNGVTMSLGISQSLSGGITEDVYYLYAPATGTHNFSITFNGTVENATIYCVTLGNAAQSNQPIATATNPGLVGANPPQATIANTKIDRSIAFSVTDLENPGGAPSAGQILIGDDESGFRVASYTPPTDPHGSVTHGYTSGISELAVIAMAAFKPLGETKDVISDGIIPYPR